MDGTLVDSMGYWQSLGREYLAQKGITQGVEELLERIKPMTMSESCSLILRTFHLPGTAEEAAAEMNAMMARHYAADVLLKPGAAEYLRALKKRGVTMCVASATAEPLVRTCLTRLGVAEVFSFLLSCESVGAGKNRPDVFLEAARRLGAASPQETAVFEDAIFAAQTAAAAGFYTIGMFDHSGERHWQQLQEMAEESYPDWAAALAAL